MVSNGPRAGIAPEHSAQLLGHEAATLGERVYLHHHGPSLLRAAALYETFVRELLGDPVPPLVAGHVTDLMIKTPTDSGGPQPMQSSA